MTDHTHLNNTQCTIEEIKLILQEDTLQKVLDEIDNIYMVFVLHGFDKDFEFVAGLINHLLRVPPPKVTCGTGSQSQNP